MVATTQGLAETLERDWCKAASFYARFGITEALLHHGVPSHEARAAKDLVDQVRMPSDGLAEVPARVVIVPATSDDHRTWRPTLRREVRTRREQLRQIHQAERARRNRPAIVRTIQ